MTVSPLHGSLIHNSFNIPDLYLAIVSYNPKSARDTFFQIINVLWIYFTFFIIHMIISAVSTSKRIDIFTRDITNPIKQVCYKMERIIEYVHNKTVLKNIQVDDIIIREETEIKQLAKHFSTTYKNQQSLGIFSQEMQKGIDSMASKGLSKDIVKVKGQNKYINDVKYYIEKM